MSLCELGCGVGNAMIPLSQKYPLLNCMGFDFSPRAIEFIEQNPAFDKERIKVTVCDLVLDPIPQDFSSPDLATLIFVLSAIAPEYYSMVCKKIYNYLKSGSILFVRDYARYDQAQLKLAKNGNSKLKDNFYVKANGTRVYYFTIEELQGYFEEAGFKTLQIENKYRVIENRKEQITMKRIWIQAKFIKE